MFNSARFGLHTSAAGLLAINVVKRLVDEDTKRTEKEDPRRDLAKTKQESAFEAKQQRSRNNLLHQQKRECVCLHVCVCACVRVRVRVRVCVFLLWNESGGRAHLNTLFKCWVVKHGQASCDDVDHEANPSQEVWRHPQRDLLNKPVPVNLQNESQLEARLLSWFEIFHTPPPRFPPQNTYTHTHTHVLMQ